MVQKQPEEDVGASSVAEAYLALRCGLQSDRVAQGRSG